VSFSEKLPGVISKQLYTHFCRWLLGDDIHGLSDITPGGQNPLGHNPLLNCLGQTPLGQNARPNFYRTNPRRTKPPFKWFCTALVAVFAHIKWVKTTFY